MRKSIYTVRARAIARAVPTRSPVDGGFCAAQSSVRRLRKLGVCVRAFAHPTHHAV
jgi:hypothetical protein